MMNYRATLPRRAGVVKAGAAYPNSSTGALAPVFQRSDFQ